VWHPESVDVLELARELVGIESVTHREGNVAAHVSERLEDHRWRVLQQPIPGGDGAVKAPRCNVLALDDDLTPPVVVFTTHLDTVPPFIPPTEDDTYLYGRGTCDAKGIFAAQWLAAEALRQKGYRGLGLLGVVGEETDSIGAKRASEVLPKARFIVDGEPTNLVMTSAAKGILSMKVRTRGVAGHSAYPERGRSAIHALVTGLSRLLAAELPSEPEFGATTANIGGVRGGLAPNVIAPEAEADLMIRLGAPLERVKQRVLELLGPDFDHEIPTASEPLRIHVPDGYTGTPVAFGSDVPYLGRLGTTLLVGPGSIHDAHTRGEKISKDELQRSVAFFVELGERLFAEAGVAPAGSAP
jgi:acetylornithine deacetylase